MLLTEVRINHRTDWSSYFNDWSSYQPYYWLKHASIRFFTEARINHITDWSSYPSGIASYILTRVSCSADWSSLVRSAIQYGWLSVLRVTLGWLKLSCWKPVMLLLNLSGLPPRKFQMDTAIFFPVSGDWSKDLRQDQLRRLREAINDFD